VKEFTLNADFATYYKDQGVVPEGEWDAFVAAMGRPLPVTFRVNPLSPGADLVRARLSAGGEYGQPFELEDGRVLDAPRPLPWYPNNDGFQLGQARGDLKKSPRLHAMHQWLIVLTAEGGISRQEAVSMVPPLLLAVQPHHYVLDMCASPGSKTAQLLEALHGGESRGVMPTGMVLANDNDSKRAYMLVHQCLRIGSHQLLVTCHDAQSFPNLDRKPMVRWGPDGDPRARADAPTAAVAGAAAAASVPAAADDGDESRGEGFFDRVLCDVPCSGDGTVRKNADVMPRWAPSGGNGLHPLQLLIGMRGLALLKPGGLMAYSTCSLNPVENEAVVAEMLRQAGGAVELVDVSDRLPGLVRQDGMSTWKVYDGRMAPYARYEDAKAAVTGGDSTRSTRRITASMFPPSPAEATTMHLERCMRILPHSTDTGGFFICLLKKTAHLPSLHNAKPLGVGAEMAATRAAAEAATAAETAAAAAAATIAVGSDDGDGGAEASDEEAGEDAGEADDGAEAVGADEPASEDEAVADGESPNTSAGAAGTEVGVKRQRPWAAGQGADAQAGAPPQQQRRGENGAVAVAAVAAGTNGSDVAAAAETSADGAAIQYDRHGRVLTGGRYALTIFSPADEANVRSLCDYFGIAASFPIHLLFQRSESGRTLTMVAEPLAQRCLPHQKDALGRGKLKVVSGGLKVFHMSNGSPAEKGSDAPAVEAGATGNSAVDAAIAPAAAAAAPTAASSGPSVPAADYRIMQEGVFLLAPFMTRQIVHASGAEIVQVLRFRGQYILPHVYSRRLQAAVASVACGSFVLVYNAALDGHEDDELPYPAAPAAAGGAGGAVKPIFAVGTTVAADARGVQLLPAAHVRVADAAAVPAPLRAHYTVTASDGSVMSLEEAAARLAKPGDPAPAGVTGDTRAAFTPALRVWTGSDPLNRAIVCMWRGKARFNVMMNGTEIAHCDELLKARGYK
jgi:16S rRNA C967 or C1407 C5-methylase (RsmB/RsmF family)